MQQDQLKPPKRLRSQETLISSFIGSEKSLDAVFLVQGLEVVVPCQYRISQQTNNGQIGVSRTTNMLLICIGASVSKRHRTGYNTG